MGEEKFHPSLLSSFQARRKADTNLGKYSNSQRCRECDRQRDGMWSRASSGLLDVTDRGCSQRYATDYAGTSECRSANPGKVQESDRKRNARRKKGLKLSDRNHERRKFLLLRHRFDLVFLDWLGDPAPGGLAGCVSARLVGTLAIGKAGKHSRPAIHHSFHASRTLARGQN